MDHSSHLNWARSLESVLSDRLALDAFQEWLIEYSSPQYLDLYFAIRAYERMALEGKPEKNQLAKSIYSKFLSSRTGNCESIPSRYRAPIGEKIRHGIELEDRIFSQCSSFVIDFLRRQHEEFVSSDEFIEAFNKMTLSANTSCDPPSTAHQNTIERRTSAPSTSSLRRSAAQTATQLTAEALLKSKHDRHSKLGETKLEKMYPPTRQPYVCNATTSHNDSAVSSSFSGETPGSHRVHSHRIRHVRDEQARENTHTFTLPRVEKDSKSTEGQQFDHSSESGRRYFAMEIIKKLMRHVDKMRVNEEMEKQINDIQECRYTTIDMVNGTEADVNLEKIDEDEELDDYLKMKMTDDSQKGSAARSPKGKSAEKSKNTTQSPPPPPPPIPRESVLHNTIRSSRRSSGHSKELDPSPRGSHHHHHSSHHPRHHQIDNRMSQSLISGHYSSASSSSFSRSGVDSFAPSPMKWTQSSSKSSQMYDSSGIGSMAPSAFSATSSESRDGIQKHRQRKMMPSELMRAPNSTGNMVQQVGTGRRHKSGKNLSNLITISYVGPDKVPVVAHVPKDGAMTLFEFKRHFALTSGQLFFKTDCEDGTAPFQLLLIKDEHHLLPVFEDRISAELR